MSRELKFRAEHGGEFVYGLISYDEDGDVILTTELGWTFDIDEETVGQYTGLKDRNGVEIYEGDILKCGDGYLWEVKWNDVNCGFLAEGEDVSTLAFDSEVISNIYQNPELLK